MSNFRTRTECSSQSTIINTTSTPSLPERTRTSESDNLRNDHFEDHGLHLSLSNGRTVSTREYRNELHPVMRSYQEKLGSNSSSDTVPNDKDFRLIDLYRGSSPTSRTIASYYSRKHRREQDRRKVLRAIHCIVTNLADWLNLNQADRPLSGVALRLTPSAYRLPANLTCEQSERWVCYSGVKRAIDWLTSRDWISTSKGTARFGAGEANRTTIVSGGGRLTRILPTEALTKLIVGFNRSPNDFQGPHEESLPKEWGIVMKTDDSETGQKEKIRMDPACQSVLFLNGRLDSFNEMNIKNEWIIHLPHYSELGTPVSVDATKIERNALAYSKNYNRCSFEYNGRYYSKVSNIKRPHRLHITVNGLPLVELDIVSLHIRMCYDYAGIQHGIDDFYNLREVGDEYLPHLEPLLRRELIKCLMLALINKRRGTPTQGLDNLLHGHWRNGRRVEGQWTVALRKIREEISHKIQYGIPLNKKDQLDYPDVWDWERDVVPAVDAIWEYHKPIADAYLGRDWGLQFQHLDSRIADHVADVFTQLGKPLLILHDGFFSSIDNEQVLRKAILEGYRLIMGFPLPDEALKSKYVPQIKTSNLIIAD